VEGAADAETDDGWRQNDGDECGRDEKLMHHFAYIGRLADRMSRFAYGCGDDVPFDRQLSSYSMEITEYQEPEILHVRRSQTRFDRSRFA
jgi:hypothetical protein